MKNRKFLFLALMLIGSVTVASSQELLALLDEEQKDTIGYVTSTFKMTRIAVGHSTEVRGEGVLEVFAANRFWNLPKERSQTFAADKMSTRLALEYGVTNKLSFGLGATTFDGLFDSYLKYKLLSQKNGGASFPVTTTVLQSVSYNSSGIPNPAISDAFSDRISATTQVLLSRKVTSKFSFQVAPTYVFKGLQFSKEDPQHFFAIGLGARYKVGRHVAVVSEFYHTFNPIASFDTYGPFALGVNWELGDVLLQFMLTNAVNMVEDAFITQTRNNFNFRNPNLNFGFNATYVIHFKNRLKDKVQY